VTARSTAHNLVSGECEVIKCAPRRLAESFLPKLTDKQCTGYGIPRNHNARKLTTKKQLTDNMVKDGYLARGNAHMRWPDGPAIFMVDYDPEEGSALSPAGLLDSLYSLCPALQSSAHVHWYSSSSYLYDRDAEHFISEANGQRVYIFVKSGRDIPRAADVLFKRAWLLGYGRIAISKSGQLLTRCSLFDASVFQPSRIDFCAGPICVEPLDSRRPLPVLHGDENVLLDTTVALPDLSDAELARFKELVAAEKQKLLPQAAPIREQWVNERVAEQSARGKDPDMVRDSYARAVAEDLLEPAFELITSDGEVVTVEKILSEPAKYHQQRFRDPLEPDYRDDERIAIAFTIGPRPVLYSHAHGGYSYRLQGKCLSVTISGGTRDPALVQIVSFLGDRLLAFADHGLPYSVTSEGRLELIDVPKAVRLIDQHVELMKPTKTEPARINCTEQLGKLFIGAYGKDLPEITVSVQQPIMDHKSGAVLAKTGYYADHGCLVIEREDDAFVMIPDTPDMKQVSDALRDFWYPVHLFPYAGHVDQSVVLTAMLTALVRPLLDKAPAFAIDAPVQGSGKSLLAETVGQLSGRGTVLLPASKRDNEEEIRKRVLSTLLEKPPTILTDNIVGEFDSPSFAAMLTANTFSDRVLGKSQNASVRPRSLMLFTGNNLCFRGDMARRVYTARIDPKIASPHQRHFSFDPKVHVEEHRQALVAAGLTLLRAYQVYMPAQRPGVGRTASFEAWDDTVRQTVCWLAALQRSGELTIDNTIPQLCDPNEALNEAIQQDPEISKLQRVLVAMVLVVGFNNRKTIAEISRECLISNDRMPDGITTIGNELNSALADVAGDAKESKINPRSAGRWCAKHKDRIVNGIALRKGVDRGGSATWYVEDVTGGGLEGFGGYFSTDDEEESKNTNIKDGEITPLNPQTTSSPQPRDSSSCDQEADVA
jgi:hypothetical protein